MAGFPKTLSSQKAGQCGGQHVPIWNSLGPRSRPSATLSIDKAVVLSSGHDWRSQGRGRVRPRGRAVGRVTHGDVYCSKVGAKTQAKSRGFSQ
eukprot:765084-Amphidinium_carterae.2